MQIRIGKLQAHTEQIQASLIARAQQREREKREEEERQKVELRDLETLEKNRSSLVLQLQAKKHQEQAKVGCTKFSTFLTVLEHCNSFIIANLKSNF